MDKLMKALVYKPDGQLSMEDVNIPIPSSNQVLIKVHLTSITSSDKELLSTPPRLTTIPGSEGSGIVIQDSRSVFSRKFKGKKAAFMQLDGSLPGSWAEYVVCDEKSFMALNENIDFLKGANLMINPLTVLMMGERIKKGKHKSVIHSNAATDLGVIFIKWCHFSEIRLISVVETEEEKEKIASVAPEWVVVRESLDFEEQLKNACEQLTPTCGFDFCGGPTAGLLFNCLQAESEFFLMSGSSELSGLNPSEFIFKSKTLSGLEFRSWFDELSLLKRTKYFSKIQKVNFVFSSCLTNIYPISQFEEGIRNYQSLGANLFHFACDLHNNSSHQNEDIFSQYISERLKARIQSLPIYPWTGTEYPLKLISDGIYKGEIINDKPIGQGILLSDNSYYTGSFQNGQKHGKGRLITEDFWYEGDFSNNTCEGTAKMTTFEGHSQEGTFLNGKISGLGVEILVTGEKYEGGFLNGLRNGQGEIFFEGIKFEGTFKEGLANGEGWVRFEDGSVFYGIYVDGVGNGELKKVDGTVLYGNLCGSKFVEKEKN